jgi:hypothetical protein
MNHQLFGKLKYQKEGWLGEAMLPAFAAVGRRPEPQPLSEEESLKLATQALDILDHRVKKLLAGAGAKKLLEVCGAGAEKLLEVFSRKTAEREAEGDNPDPKPQEREGKRADRIAKQAESLARGLFPIYIQDPKKQGPSKQQEAAFRHLISEPDNVFKVVMGELFQSFQDAYSDPHWRKICRLRPAKNLADLAGQYAIKRVDIYRAHHKGTSYLVFLLDAQWQGDDGLVVVYHPDKPASCTSAAEVYYEIEPDEPG